MTLVKQIILVRNDLRNVEGHKVLKGKIIAQACHASLNAFLQSLKYSLRTVYSWTRTGHAKVILSINSEEEYWTFVEKLKLAKIPHAHIIDKGLTEFGGHATPTCIGIGPWKSEEIDLITGHLKLYT